MAELSRGEPIAVLEQQLTAEEYAQAALQCENVLFPLHRTSVSAGACLCAAVLVASLIPWYSLQFATVFLPVSGIVFFLVLALYFWREQPRRRRRNALVRFGSSRLLGLPGRVTVFRDGMQLENSNETWGEFWTDFSGCVQLPDYIVLWGGISRPLLILKKNALPQEQMQLLCTHLKNEFADRCRCENGGRAK